MRIYIFILIASLIYISINGQVEKRLLRKGNLHYQLNDFEQAAQYYEKSFDTLSTYDRAQFNLGNANYRLSKLDDAIYAYEMHATKAEDKLKKSSAFHNLGNSYMQKYAEATQLAQQASPDTAQMLAQGAHQFLSKSVEAYKNALRNNPFDDETRYNLALAKKLLEQFQQNQDQSGGQNDQNQEQNQEQEEQESQEKQQNQDQDSQNDQEKNEEKQDEQQSQENKQDSNEGKEQQMQPQQISKEDAEKLLEALKNQEQKLHEKMKKRKKPAKAIVIEKNW